MEAKDLIVGMVIVQFIALCVMLILGVYYLTDIEGLGIAVVITTAFIVMTLGTLLGSKPGGF